MVSSTDTIGAFNIGFVTVNLHRPTRSRQAMAAAPAPVHTRRTSAMSLPAMMSAFCMAADTTTAVQGLTLVHFLAQRKRLM